MQAGQRGARLIPMPVQAEITIHIGEDGIEHLGVFEFATMPRVGEFVEVVGLDRARRFGHVIRVSHRPVGTVLGENVDEFQRQKGPAVTVVIQRR